MNRFDMQRGIAVGLALAVGLVHAPRAANAEPGVVEVDVFGGWHIVSPRSDLGKPQNRDQVPADSGLFGFRLGVYIVDQLALEGEVSVLPTNATGDSDDHALMYGYRVQLVLELARIKELGGTLSLVAGIGGLTTGSSDKNGEQGYLGAIDAGTVIMPQAGLAAKVALGDTWGLRFDGRTFFVPASDLDDGASLTLDYEATVGLYKHFGAGKKARPEPEPEPEPGVQPVADSDGDGLKDDRDPCPDKAEDKDGFQDGDGCPDLDNDADGVLDADDKCPDQAEDKDGFSDQDGCPDPDNDDDGLADAQDKCPNEPEDKDGFTDEDGCPDPDNDNDGVLDADDKCPEQLETRNGFQDRDGCADDLPKAVAKYTGVIPGINFATGKATIKKPSFRVLDAAIKVLNDYPELRIEIGGHTDDVGDPESNKALSQARAEAVRAYMIGKGITDDRIRAVGYGQEKPLIDEKTRKARAKNRRVEFVLITE